MHKSGCSEVVLVVCSSVMLVKVLVFSIMVVVVVVVCISVGEVQF